MSGYEGAGTDMNDGQGYAGGDAPGSGWGGITNTAGYAQRQGVGGLSQDKSLTGFNSENPTQSVGEFENAQNVNKALSWGAPMAMSAVAPGFGLVNTTMKAAANLKAGMNPMEAVGGLISSGVNSLANKATGGVYGMARQAGMLSSALGGPAMPDLGKEVASAMAGKSTGLSAQAGPAMAMSGEGPGGDPAAPGAQTAQAPAAVAASANDGVDFSILGTVDSAGWTNAFNKYKGSKNGLV